ncbi:MAG: o-succinylbenzoate synthase [Crocinitomicaceae bacterium]
MLKSKLTHYPLKFIRPAGTSRGIMLVKNSWIIALQDKNLEGFGEFSIIETLSPDWSLEYPKILKQIIQRINAGELIESLIQEYSHYPSIVFGLETALLDLQNGGKRELFNTNFFSGKQRIPINGLIWMNDAGTMLESIKEKLDLGFNCIKLKIGAIDFPRELELLQFIRKTFDSNTIEIRVDANGAFSFDRALEVLRDLAQLEIHSIEQPIRQGQIQEMAKLCSATPTPIALDEELIGIHEYSDKKQLLEQIRPQYIILKPSLHGGLKGSKEWIELAEELHIGWWITSALESNIGLNAIAQFASTFNTKMYQGLGTGSLYHNNISSPLTVEKGHIFYDQDKEWIIPSNVSLEFS